MSEHLTEVDMLTQWINASPERAQSYLGERLKVDTSELIWARMQAQKVSKAALAKQLRCSKSHVTGLLNGSRNMTLETLADIAAALGCRVNVRLVKLPKRANR